MKKLKLNSLQLKAKEVLSREQLKKILGSGGSGCAMSPTCPPGSHPCDCRLEGGKCMPYCSFDSTGNCYGTGSASC